MLAERFECVISSYELRYLHYKNRAYSHDNIYYLDVRRQLAELSVQAIVDNVFEPISIELWFSDFHEEDSELIEQLETLKKSKQKVLVKQTDFSLIDGVLTIYNPVIEWRSRQESNLRLILRRDA